MIRNLKHEVRREPCDIALDCLHQGPGFYTVEVGKLAIASPAARALKVPGSNFPVLKGRGLHAAPVVGGGV